MGRILLESFVHTIVWGALLLLALLAFTGCAPARAGDELGAALSGVVLVASWAGIFGWYLRGWYDRRMRPGPIEREKCANVELTSRLAKQWTSSLAQVDRGLS